MDFLTDTLISLIILLTVAAVVACVLGVVSYLDHRHH